MKCVVLAAVTFLFCLTLVGAEPTLTKEERAKALKLLQESQDQFLSSVETLTDAQWKYKPGPDRWSVAEVAEHIMLSEELLFGNVQQLLAGKPDPDWETKTAGKEQMLERVLLNRERKAQAPEALRPQGKWTPAEILSRFKEARARTRKFVEETGAPLKEHTRDHPIPVFGTLNAYQWLLYIPLHNLRHNEQIREVKAVPGFPR